MGSFRSTVNSLQTGPPLRRVAGLIALFAVLALPAGLLFNVQILLATVVMGHTAGVEEFMGLLLVNVPAGCLLTVLGFWLMGRLAGEADKFAMPCFAVLAASYSMLAIHVRELATKTEGHPGARFGLLAGMVVIGLLCAKVARTHSAGPGVAAPVATDPSSLS